MLHAALTSCIYLMNVVLTELGFPSDQSWMSPQPHPPHICVLLHKNTGNQEKRWNPVWTRQSVNPLSPTERGGGEDVQQQARLSHMENWRFASLFSNDLTVMRGTVDWQKRMFWGLKHMNNGHNNHLIFANTLNKAKLREFNMPGCPWICSLPRLKHFCCEKRSDSDKPLVKCTVVKQV